MALLWVIPRYRRVCLDLLGHHALEVLLTVLLVTEVT